MLEIRNSKPQQSEDSRRQPSQELVNIRERQVAVGASREELNESQMTFIEAVTAHRGEIWRSRATCYRIGTDIFFPRPGVEKKKHLKEAEKLCQYCRAQEECHKHSLLETGYDLHGIWAGLTAAQIKQIRKESKLSKE